VSLHDRFPFVVYYAVTDEEIAIRGDPPRLTQPGDVEASALNAQTNVEPSSGSSSRP
jgi:hypothetical protein